MSKAAAEARRKVCCLKLLVYAALSQECLRPFRPQVVCLKASVGEYSAALVAEGLVLAWHRPRSSLSAFKVRHSSLKALRPQSSMSEGIKPQKEEGAALVAEGLKRSVA